jgi:hypothetical protein
MTPSNRRHASGVSHDQRFRVDDALDVPMRIDVRTDDAAVYSESKSILVLEAVTAQPHVQLRAGDPQ